MIRNFLNLSTGHVSEQTKQWLDQQSMIAAQCIRTGDPTPDILIGKTPFGWFVYADEEPDDAWPEDLRRCFAHARQHGCEYVLFDCDAATIVGLPTYEW